MRERCAVGLVALALLASLACGRADGPAPVAWDRTRCAHCGMLVSDPAWAAQLHDANGQVHHFDDPGCLLVALESAALGAGPAAPKLYFHHLHQDRWIAGDAVAFTAAAHSPMAYGIGAVGADESPDAIPFDEALRLAVERDRTRRASADPPAPAAATR